MVQMLDNIFIRTNPYKSSVIFLCNNQVICFYQWEDKKRKELTRSNNKLKMPNASSIMKGNYPKQKMGFFFLLDMHPLSPINFQNTLLKIFLFPQYTCFALYAPSLSNKFS